MGIREKKPVPTLGEFAQRKFLPWAWTTFAEKPKTWLWYRNGVRRVLDYSALADSSLDSIRGEQVAAYIAHRQARGLLVSSINRELQVLLRMFCLAVEWGTLETMPRVRMLPGEKHREHVLTSEEEARYLAVAPEPLASVAAVLVDTGMRPEESFRLRWEAITWTNGRHGTLLVTQGKTAAARRLLPFTPRVRAVLEGLWEAEGRPIEGWVWSSGTRSGHIRVLHSQEAAQEGSEAKRSSSFRALLPQTHLPDPFGWKRV